MTYVLAIIVTLLTMAVIVLFAMLGELYARVKPAAGNGGGSVQLLADVKLGGTPDSWPEELSALAQRDRFVILVLSSVCTSCANVAQELADIPDPLSGWPIGVVISAPDRKRGEDFAHASPGIPRFPYLVDPGGSWVGDEFGVGTSPTALVLLEGELASALGFTALATLRQAAIFSQEEAAA